MTTKTTTIENRTTINSKVLLYVINSGKFLNWTEDYNVTIPWVKYQIKETDFRVKTATLTTPVQFDLTKGLHSIRIVSSLHENFVGFVLSNEYTENSDGTYSYQLQDMSRQYMSKIKLTLGGNVSVYRALKWLLTKGGLPLTGTIPKKQSNPWKPILAGLRPQDYYSQKLWGNYLNINTMTYKPKMIIKDKSFIEVIRDLTVGYMRYIDVYFDETGHLQIKPFSVKDWMNTGLVLTTEEFSSRKFKFDITNVITGVGILPSDDGAFGNVYSSSDLIGLDLTVFFGNVGTYVSDPNQKETTSSGSSTSNATKNSSSTTANNKYGNPFNNKPKRVWINADGGSGSMKERLAAELRKDGWTVHVGATGAKYHYDDYFKVTSKYSVYITLYNGFCAGTMREAYSSKIQNELKRKGVQLCPIWDTGSWHNQKTRYGNFDGYYAPRAHDDNFSSGNPAIKDTGAFLKSNKATYCAAPSASQIMQQFRAGGYFKYKGINV